MTRETKREQTSYWTDEARVPGATGAGMPGVSGTGVSGVSGASSASGTRAPGAPGAGMPGVSGAEMHGAPSETEATNDATKISTPNRDALTLDFLVTIIGFGLCRAWIIFCLGAPLVAGATNSRTWLYLAFGALSALVVAFAVNRNGKRETGMRVVLFRMTPLAVLAGGTLISLALWMGNEWLLASGFVISGLGAGPLQVLWGDRFAHHPIRFAMLASPAAAVVTALVAGLSTQAGFIGFAIIPLVSFGLLLFEAHRTGISWADLSSGTPNTTKDTPDQGVRPLVKNTSPDAPANDGGTFAHGVHFTEQTNDTCVKPATAQQKSEHRGLGLGKLMFSIMVFSVLCRLFDATQVREDPFAFMGGSAIFSLIVVGVVFLVIVAKLGERFNPTFTYRLSLPIMVAGFVAIALLFDTHAAVSILLINVGYEFFDILAWVLFADVAQRRNENSLHVFGLGVAFMFAGMALGTAAGNAIDALIVSGDVQISVVAMLSILCLVIVAFMVFPEGALAQVSSTMRVGRKDRESADDEAERLVSGARGVNSTDATAMSGRIEQHCAMVAQDFGLTPREGEVIVLLAYGRTLSIIARDLQIAKGTARTHIENIYRKLDVHKQQELIDLVESYTDEANAQHCR